MGRVSGSRLAFACAASAAWLLGCAGEAPPDAGDPTPPSTSGYEADLPTSVLGLSTYEASLGTLIEVYGTNFPGPAEGETYLVFQGVFRLPDGGSEPVDLELPTRRVDAGTLRWTGFGPYRNPLSAGGDAIGTFEGRVATRVVQDGGAVIEDPKPVDITLEVKPSILVHEIQPVTASCNAPIKRVLGGAAYRMRVEAVGFEPVSFTYTMAAPALQSPALSIRHLAQGQFDSVGDRGNFVAPQVPESMQSYGAVLSVSAMDTEGRQHQSAFAVAVHRPLEIFYNGNIDIAEILAPVPVSGCIPGGTTSRSVAYHEATTETRTRSYNVSWNESWLNSHTVSAGTTDTIGLSETNGVGFSTTDGQRWNWSLGGEVGGKFNVASLVEIGVSANGSIGGETSRAATNSARRDRGVNAATTTTETESASQSMGGQVGGGFSWQVSSSETISQSFGGHVLPRTFGVFYRQTMRLVRKAAVVTYNQCGAANVVADLDFADWTWAPDLALGNACPPLPASNLPPAECTIPPCSGQ